jgi:regulatory protein YycH of two-component signal transduction system YycFG
MEELQTFIEDQNFKRSKTIEPDQINIDHNDSHYERTPKNLEKSASFKVSHVDSHSTNSHRRTLSDYNQYVFFFK